MTRFREGWHRRQRAEKQDRRAAHFRENSAYHFAHKPDFVLFLAAQN
jgi:hypothetical protein